MVMYLQRLQFISLTLAHFLHLPQLEKVYGEVLRVLKPGAFFATYEWVATKDYDPANPDHVRIIDEINYGNGLPVCILLHTPPLTHAGAHRSCFPKPQDYLIC